MNLSYIEYVKPGHMPLPRRENDERLREFRIKMALRATVVPNTYFHNRLNKGK